MRRLWSGIIIVGFVALTAFLAGTGLSARPAISGSNALHARSLVPTRSDIYVIALATGRITKITRADFDAFYDSPSWSPDGHRLAFSGSPCDDCPSMDAQLYVADLKRGRISRVGVSISPAARPSWDPRRRLLAFVGGPEDWIYSIHLDGSGLKRLAGGLPHDDVAWSPTGDRIAYTTQQANGRWDLYVRRIGRHRQHALTHTAAAEEQPAWSRNGRIAFTRQGSDGTWSIYVVDAEGRHLHRVGPRWSASSENPTWSPDGARLAFTALTRVKAALYVMNADGARVRRLETRMTRSYDPSWSPDGRMLAFVGSR